jgi:hypothetical protein
MYNDIFCNGIYCNNISIKNVDFPSGFPAGGTSLTTIATGSADVGQVDFVNLYSLATNVSLTGGKVIVAAGNKGIVNVRVERVRYYQHNGNFILQLVVDGGTAALENYEAAGEPIPAYGYKSITVELTDAAHVISCNIISPVSVELVEVAIFIQQSAS